MEQLAGAIRVVVVDRHQMVAESIRVALDHVADFSVAALACSHHQAVLLVRVHQPDVVVLDGRLPDVGVADSVAGIVAASPDARVLVIDAVVDHRSVVQAVEAGAAGYLLKDQPLSDLVTGIRSAHAGHTVVAPAAVPALVAGVSATASRASTLNTREVEVLRLVAEGLSTAELATRMGVTVDTIRNTVQSVLTRLGAHSKLQAVSIGVREGIIALPSAAR
jgi:DNA-binding NarL/FixJ family response regulator